MPFLKWGEILHWKYPNGQEIEIYHIDYHFVSFKPNSFGCPLLGIRFKPLKINFNEGGKWFVLYLNIEKRYFYFSFPYWNFRRSFCWGKKCELSYR